MERQGPRWATPDRQTHLVNLFHRSGGFCIFGHKPCPHEHHHYEVFIDGLIGDWIAQDRAQSQAEWKAEQRAIHNLGECGPQRGEFNATGRDAFYAEQPQYYVKGLGISGLTFKPFAKVRLSSSYVHLHVDLGDTLKGMGKAKRRKVIRYGKPLPDSISEEVDKVCKEAVEHYRGKGASR